MKNPAIAMTTDIEEANRAFMLLKKKGIPVFVVKVGKHWYITSNKPVTAQKALIGAGLVKNPMTKVHPLAIEAKKKWKEDMKAGHGKGEEYWAGAAGAAYLLSNPGYNYYYCLKCKKEHSYYSKIGIAHRKYRKPPLPGYANPTGRAGAHFTENPKIKKVAFVSQKPNGMYVGELVGRFGTVESVITAKTMNEIRKWAQDRGATEIQLMSNPDFPSYAVKTHYRSGKRILCGARPGSTGRFAATDKLEYVTCEKCRKILTKKLTPLSFSKLTWDNPTGQTGTHFTGNPKRIKWDPIWDSLPGAEEDENDFPVGNPPTTLITKKNITQSAIDKFITATTRPLRKPTKLQLKKWAKMPDPFAEITDKDREEAFKKGYII